MLNPQKNIPTVLIIFGATGDLMAKKITPALYNLFQQNLLPDMFTVVGFSRQKLTDAKFRQHIGDILKKKYPKETTQIEGFLKAFHYQPGLFEDLPSYKQLHLVTAKIDKQWGVCSNKLFYLAVPPRFYDNIFDNLSKSKLTKPCSAEEGWTRVIVEKPFGKDAKTAKNLEIKLCQLFREIQIYRIDHYLAKEMLQNIMAFRFTNNLFELNWGKDLIEKIHIRLWEKIGVEDRGAFYDGVGALRDVGQNHLLQMLAFITMGNPREFTADQIRSLRSQILNSLIIPDETEIKQATYRAQHQDYHSIDGVNIGSATETFFKVRAFLNHPNWVNVPITLESGKRLKEQIKEIEIVFKHPLPCLCPKGTNQHTKNRLFIKIEPSEGIKIEFWSKKPGYTMEVAKESLDFQFRRQAKHSQYTEEYEKLLLDCISGDQTLFVSSDEIKAMWRFVDPILKSWEKDRVPLAVYKSDTLAPVDASRFIDDLPRYLSPIKNRLGIIGLGKMGGNIARRLMRKQWQVHGYNRDIKTTKQLVKEGLHSAKDIPELIAQLEVPRLIWLMIPAGQPVEDALFGKNGLADLLDKGDIIIDGGNSFYEDTIQRAEKLKKKGIHYIDAGVSGGPAGALNGSSIMIGGDKKIFSQLEYLFYDLAVDNGYGYMGPSGSGHFVKMVHNGIEYGMMQAIAEGFTVLKNYPDKLDMDEITRVYNHGSVIQSNLIGWLQSGYEEYGDNLTKVSGSVAHTGEGEWTVKTAQKLGVNVPVIKEAFKFRVKSAKQPSYTGKILSTLRHQFGGHSIK